MVLKISPSTVSLLTNFNLFILQLQQVHSSKQSGYWDLRDWPSFLYFLVCISAWIATCKTWSIKSDVSTHTVYLCGNQVVLREVQDAVLPFKLATMYTWISRCIGIAGPSQKVAGLSHLIAILMILPESMGSLSQGKTS